MPKDAKDPFEDPEIIKFINKALKQSISENSTMVNHENNAPTGTQKEYDFLEFNDLYDNEPTTSTFWDKLGKDDDAMSLKHLSPAESPTNSVGTVADSESEDVGDLSIINELQYLDDYYNILTIIDNLPPNQVPIQLAQEMHNGTAGGPSDGILDLIHGVVIDRAVKYPCITFKSGGFQLDVIVDSKRLKTSFDSLEEAVVGYIYVKKLAQQSPNITEPKIKTFNAALDHFESLRKIYDNFEKYQKKYPAVIDKINNCYNPAPRQSKRLRN